MKISALLLIILATIPLRAEDFSFSLSELEDKKAALQFSGSIEAGFSALELRRESPFFNAAYPAGVNSDWLGTSSAGLFLNGDYQSEQTAAAIKTYTQLNDGKDADFSLLEAYGSYSPSVNTTFTGGKKNFYWGKGYAFNPAGLINSRKDPQDPEALPAGKISFFYQYNRSLGYQALTNAALDLALLSPEQSDAGNNFELDKTVLAARLYLLALDIDLDLMFMQNGSNQRALGFDFAANILPELEIHGECAWFDYSRKPNNKSGEFDWLIGLRYLSQSNITFILEYYRNGAGFGKSDLERILSASAVAAAAPQQSANMMSDYLYAKLSWPEPFEILYFTPSFYTVMSLADQSFTAGLPLLYKPVTNLDIQLLPAIFNGSRLSEFGSKLYDFRLNGELKFYF